MKKKFSLMTMVGVVLTLGMVQVGCDGNEPPPPPQCTVSYAPGRGEGSPPVSLTVDMGKPINLPNQENMTAPAGETFDGWKDGGGTAYQAGDSYTVTANVLFTAQWKKIDNPQAVTGVSLNKAELSLTVGASETLTATIAPSDATNKAVSWSSSNNAIATVSDGTVTGVAEGSATITVSTVDGGKTANATITVNRPIAPDPALKAVGVAASPSGPEVLDSYKLGTTNYYLIDVGTIRNTYISTIIEGYFDGFNPVSVSKTTVTDKTISNSITNTVSTSITESDTQNHTAGIDFAWKKKFPIVGQFSVKLKYEWKGSWTNSETNTNTIETSSSEIISVAESFTTSINFGENGGPRGNYRYALYGVSKVYFMIATSSDNSELLSWETVVSASNTQPHMDYSPDGIFDNSPEKGNTIDISEDFFKNLPLPSSGPTNPTNSIAFPLEVWGGKLKYTYKVLTAGTISYTLTGGGAGGAGGAALRDVSWWYWWDTKSKVDAGWSLDGGPTKLFLTGVEKESADGGVGVNGPYHTADSNAPWTNDGVKGNDGETISSTLSVAIGDIITIEVGWGGGGSGGAANNDTDKSISSDYNSSNRNEKTTGSAGASANTNSTQAAASRGGMGAMHSLLFPTSEYSSNLKNGSSSSAAVDVAGADGGKEKGKGGAAGKGIVTDKGTFASGGGGGAAGGFTLNSSNVTITEIE